jgi:hypothetical protein
MDTEEGIPFILEISTGITIFWNKNRNGWLVGYERCNMDASIVLLVYGVWQGCITCNDNDTIVGIVPSIIVYCTCVRSLEKITNMKLLARELDSTTKKVTSIRCTSLHLT